MDQARGASVATNAGGNPASSARRNGPTLVSRSAAGGAPGGRASGGLPPGFLMRSMIKARFPHLASNMPMCDRTVEILPQDKVCVLQPTGCQEVIDIRPLKASKMVEQVPCEA